MAQITPFMKELNTYFPDHSFRCHKAVSTSIHGMYDVTFTWTSSKKNNYNTKEEEEKKEENETPTKMLGEIDPLPFFPSAPLEPIPELPKIYYHPSSSSSSSFQTKQKNKRKILEEEEEQINNNKKKKRTSRICCPLHPAKERYTMKEKNCGCGCRKCAWDRQ
jgi:hypothetical protein